jgi:hypothetical protein
MRLGQMLERILEVPENFRLTKRLFYLGMILTVVADLLIPRHHVYFFWDALPGFSAVYGLFSCIVIIVFSKVLGHRGLMKREDYYD